MDAVERPLIQGAGTSEAEWQRWPGLHDALRVSAEQLVPPHRRAVVVAPHPDDEVLAVGGLLTQLARSGCALLLVAVTDGTASHAGSREWPAARLARERPRESMEAWRRLGLERPDALRLGLPDGRVAKSRGRLVESLGKLLRPTDVVFTTWRCDGHPDHEATGQACVIAAERVCAHFIEVPVWAWHWARPGDARVPWHRACRLSLDDETLRRKRDALAAFTSQLTADPSTGAAPILPPTAIERARRPFEIVFA
jgi:LmbE family N-acetylglucosaminyl deacetylase